MTYGTFLQESYHAICEQAPGVMELDRLRPWLLSIGQLLLRMPPDMQRNWAERYAIVIMAKYGHSRPDIALVCVRHGLTEAEACWPQVAV